MEQKILEKHKDQSINDMRVSMPDFGRKICGLEIEIAKGTRKMIIDLIAAIGGTVFAALFTILMLVFSLPIALLLLSIVIELLGTWRGMAAGSKIEELKNLKKEKAKLESELDELKEVVAFLTNVKDSNRTNVKMFRAVVGHIHSDAKTDKLVGKMIEYNSTFDLGIE